MATGRPPFHEYNPSAAMFKVGRDRVHPDIPDTLSAAAHEFLEQCFRPDPRDRPTAAELLRHPFLSRSRARSTHAVTMDAGLETQVGSS